MVHPSLPAGFDFTDPEIYAQRLPVEEFKELRKTAPIWWNAQPDGVGGFNDGGYWVISKHKDVKEVSLRSDVFSSWENGAIPRFGVVRAAAAGHRRSARNSPGRPRESVQLVQRDDLV